MSIHFFFNNGVYHPQAAIEVPASSPPSPPSAAGRSIWPVAAQHAPGRPGGTVRISSTGNDFDTSIVLGKFLET